MLSDASRYGGSAHASGQLVYFSTESFKKISFKPEAFG